MKRMFILLLLICLALCSCQGQGLDPNSETYKRLEAAINGPTATPGPAQDPTEANIQAFAAKLNSAAPVKDYQEYARYPMQHNGERIQFSGNVLSVAGSLHNTYLVAMDGDPARVFHVYCSIERLLPGDSVSISALFTGEKSIKNDSGTYVYYPDCSAYEVEILK